MEIITGYTGVKHITPGQDRQINRGAFGEGDYVLNVGSNLNATIESANSVTLADGIVMMQGCAASISDGASQTLTVTNGTSGYKRIDLIAAVYRISADDNKESVELEVIEGTPVTDNPVIPSYDSGDIKDGATHVFPLYSVLVDGVAITEVEKLFDSAGANGISLLWTNPSPSSAFAAQTLAVTNSANYGFFFVELKYDTKTAASHATAFVVKNTKTRAAILSSDSTKNVGRDYTFNADGTVTISTGYNTSTSPSTLVAIPTRIYGVKF